MPISPSANTPPTMSRMNIFLPPVRGRLLLLSPRATAAADVDARECQHADRCAPVSEWLGGVERHPPGRASRPFRPVGDAKAAADDSVTETSAQVDRVGLRI